MAGKPEVERRVVAQLMDSRLAGQDAYIVELWEDGAGTAGLSPLVTSHAESTVGADCAPCMYVVMPTYMLVPEVTSGMSPEEAVSLHAALLRSLATWLEENAGTVMNCETVSMDVWPAGIPDGVTP